MLCMMRSCIHPWDPLKIVEGDQCTDMNNIRWVSKGSASTFADHSTMTSTTVAEPLMYVEGASAMRHCILAL